MTVTTRAASKKQCSPPSSSGKPQNLRHLIIHQDRKTKAVTLRTPFGPVSLAEAEARKDDIRVIDYECIVVSPSALPVWLTTLANVEVAREPDANVAEPLPDIKAKTYVGTCLPGTWKDGALVSAQEQYVLALDLATASLNPNIEKGVPYLHTTVVFHTSVEPLLDMANKKKGPRYPAQLTQWIAKTIKAWVNCDDEYTFTLVNTELLEETYDSDRETLLAEIAKGGCPKAKVQDLQFLTLAEYRSRASDELFAMATNKVPWVAQYQQCSI